MVGTHWNLSNTCCLMYLRGSVCLQHRHSIEIPSQIQSCTQCLCILALQQGNCCPPLSRHTGQMPDKNFLLMTRVASAEDAEYRQKIIILFGVFYLLRRFLFSQKYIYLS